MAHIIITSKNPVKIHAACDAFKKMFPGESHTVQEVSVRSDVSAQPMSDEETFRGAVNRVQNAVKFHPGADFWVGMEGGVDTHQEHLSSFAWIVVRSKEGKWGKGKTGTFILPTQVASLVRAGTELGDADDIVFGNTNSKQQNGAIGLLTDNLIDRTHFYSSATICALIPFKKPHLY
ncbi:MAG: inosine/xanthosine triphosphatase [Patescibacteria group bacterium]|nr:inosine/xanthosine triphosphatase [Patescibacteria group bacterium]MDE2437791.1 inosine/xanthosine triphosphatase [Patescibacteria group bacterium]